MMSLCKKSVHSFLGFSNFKDNLSPDFSLQNPPPVGGLTFFTVSGEVDRPVNVVESAAVKKPLPPPAPPPLPPTTTTTAATTKGHMGVEGLKDQPTPTITTTTTTAATEHMTGLDFLKSPPPTTTPTATTSVVSTTTKSDPDGKEYKKPPPPTTAPGHLGGLGFLKPPLCTTTSVVAKTTKSHPDGKEHKQPPPPPTTTTTTDILASTTKRDPGSIGFLDEVGGSVDGLMSCTESLGFESSDERRVDGQILDINLPPPLSSKPKKTIPVKKEVKKFPPLLSSLTNNGQPKFFLRPVRKEGRLELTEVKIQPPEILHASRQDGRLRLQFVCDREEEAANQETLQENPKEFQEKIQEEREAEKLEEEEEWKIPANNGGGDGFRRCHELVASHQRRHQHHQHHQHHNIWSQRCVTIG